jgi:hypothetical protein
MATTPELLWKVKIEEKGKPSRFEYITKGQATARGLIGQVLLSGEANAYVRHGSFNDVETLSAWKRRNRS